MATWEDSTTVTQVLAPTSGQTSEHLLPVEAGKAMVVVLAGGEVGRSYVVEQELMIGRSPEANVRINGDDASRKHAVIRQAVPGTFVLEDLGSKNGTAVNGERIERRELEFGDRIRIGLKAILIFTRYDSVEDQLLQTQRLESIGQLAGEVAHDFNNILGAVLANVEFLKGVSPALTFADREVRGALDDINTAARRAVEISRQLLGLSRRGKRENVRVEVEKIVAEATALLSRTAGPDIRIEVRVPSSLAVSGDPSLLTQMLMNLCINARDAMPEGGTLTVAARASSPKGSEADRLRFLGPGGHAVIAVSDTGIGMSEEVQKRIFEPFFTTKAKGKGTGLGLSTVLTIVRNHGGHVEASSQPGRGSTFQVYLPLAPTVDGRSSRFEATPTVPARHVSAGIILLVDDDEVFRNSTRRLLEGLGYPVQVAKDGIEAVQKFDLHKDMVELVLLDLVMPNLDGAEAFRALRRIDPSVRILLSSGQTESAGVRELLAEGAQGYLQKPYDANALGEAVARAMFGTPKWR